MNESYSFMVKSKAYEDLRKIEPTNSEVGAHVITILEEKKIKFIWQEAGGSSLTHEFIIDSKEFKSFMFGLKKIIDVIDDFETEADDE